MDLQQYLHAVRTYWWAVALPVVGVIEPGVRSLVRATESGRIGVIGTTARWLMRRRPGFSSGVYRCMSIATGRQLIISNPVTSPLNRP